MNLPTRATAAEMVSAVQQLYAAFARRDISAVLSALTEDVVWSEPPNPFNPSGGTRHGHTGFLEWARIGNDAEEILTLEPRQFLVGESSVAVVGFTKCQVKPTGRVYETDFVHLVTFSGGKVVKFQEFFDTFAAAEAFRP